MKQALTNYSTGMMHTTKAEEDASRLFSQLYKEYKEGAEMPLFKSKAAINNSPVYISDNMSGKMQDIYSISTCCLCNGNCKRNRSLPDSDAGNGCICRDCFAVDTQKQYNALRDHTVYNSAILAAVVLPMDALPLLTVDICRLESFGDLINKTQAINYINIARKNPRTVCTLWTKNPDIMDAAIKEAGKPSNMILIVSSHYKNEIAEARYSWIDHIFTVWDSREKAAAAGITINCRAIVNGEEHDRCRLCMRCYTLNNSDFYIHELLK